MSISLMTDVWRLPLQAPRKMVLLALADNSNDEGTDCWPSIGKLVEKCSMSERAVQGHLAALEESGYIKRHERLGRSNKFTVYVERIRLEILQKTQQVDPTPADSAPPENVAKSPPQILHPTPADSAPITTKEPSLKTTTTSSDAIESCGGGPSKENLYYPICIPEESSAIADLVAGCPEELRQKMLDEIEGARQAGVIKTNLVPFARGVLHAIHRGTFTVGHGPKVALQRSKQLAKRAQRPTTQLNMDPETMNRGKSILGNRPKKSNGLAEEAFF